MEDVLLLHDSCLFWPWNWLLKLLQLATPGICH